MKCIKITTIQPPVHIPQIKIQNSENLASLFSSLICPEFLLLWVVSPHLCIPNNITFSFRCFLTFNKFKKMIYDFYDLLYFSVQHSDLYP